MEKFHAIIRNPTRLRALTGLSTDEFEQLLVLFTQAIPIAMEQRRMDGYIREGRSWSSYKNAPLPTDADKLVFILVYLRQNPIQAVQGQIFQMTQSNVSKWVRRTKEMLEIALTLDHALPCRSVPAFQEYLQQIGTNDDTPPLFIMMGRSGQ